MNTKENTTESNGKNQDTEVIIDFLDLLKTIHRLFPALYQHLDGSDQGYDLRRKQNVIYPMAFILFLVLMKDLLSIASMRAFSTIFHKSTDIQSILYLSGVFQIGLTKLPHFQTINNFMSMLDPKFLEDLLFLVFKTIIDSKFLYDYRFRQMWVIAVDATEIYNGRKKLNDKCLYRVHNRGKVNQYTEYYISVLVASLVLVGTKVSIPICCVFIENNAEDAERQRNMSIENIKQDCETKAFKRLAKIIKSRFRNMNICFLFDSLYASKPIMEICLDNNWDFIIRYKEGSYPEIQENVDGLNKKRLLNYMSDDESAKYGYRDVFYTVGIILSVKVTVNFVHATSTVKNENYASFQWITSLQITDYRVYQTINVGRARWLIENQIFHRLKKWSNNIEHMRCHNENAIKNHFRMTLIAETFRILYEFETFSDNSPRPIVSENEIENNRPPFYYLKQQLSETLRYTDFSRYSWTKMYEWRKRGRGRPKALDTA